MASSNPQGNGNGDNGSDAAYTRRDVEQAVTEAFIAHGYVIDEKLIVRRNQAAIVEVIYPPILQAHASNKDERANVMVTRGKLMELAFPDVIGPNDWHEQDNPEFAEAVHKSLEGKVWGLVASDHTGSVQRKLGEEQTGLVLCRLDGKNKLKPAGSQDAVHGVYVTDDWGCMMLDFFSAKEKAFLNMAEGIGMNLEMVGIRLPEHVQRANKLLHKTMKTALNKGESAFAPALEAANSDEDDE